MAKKEFPRFVIYQPNRKEFHFCFEAGGKCIRWCSYYPPTLDTRYSRNIERIEDLSVKKLPGKNIFDQGTYNIPGSDSKELIEKKMLAGIKENIFSFSLDGKKLKGRFAIKQNKAGTILQKYKDKYAVEQDVLSGDLSRTISAMIPDYDESKVKLTHAKKTKAVTKAEDKPTEEITADKKIGNIIYHFTHYSSDDAADIFLVTAPGDGVHVLKRSGNRWMFITPVSRTMQKNEKELIGHAKALYALQTKD